MGSVTLSPEADFTGWTSPQIAAGVGNHLPVGDYGSADYRSFLRFPLPAGWLGWTGITKATLTFYISDFSHVGPKNSSIYVRRESFAGAWTSGEGSQSCESGFTGGNGMQEADVNLSLTNQVTFSSGTTENAKKSVVITAMVKEMWAASPARTKLVFGFDNAASGDYTEIWSRHKTGGYNIELTIDYTDNVPPTAPTLDLPSAGSTQVSQTPTYDWTHNDPDGDPQAGAEVARYNSTGGTLQATHVVTGAATVLVSPDTLTRGTTYQFRVRTKDASGIFGPWSAMRSFTIKALPTVTIDPVRYQEWSGGKVCLRIKWSIGAGASPQTKYRIQSTNPVYDTGFISSTSQSVLLTSPTVINGSATNITVSVETSDALQGVSALQSFRPRWGQTVHRRDLTTAPVGWGTPTVTSTTPAGTQVIMEYSANAAGGLPGAWYSTLSSAAKARYVFYRATLIPSATASPSLDKVVIPANYAIPGIDHWYGNTAATPSAMPTGWGVDEGEYVYGTRSLSKDGTGAAAQAVYSERIRLRAGRSYVLTGLMKSEGNSGAVIRLFDADTATLLTQPDGTGIQTDMLFATRDWFQPDVQDTYRYKTPVYVSPTDNDVCVQCRFGNALNTSAWFDGLKLEESTVATPWGPSAVGAVAADAGGIQIDGTKGGVFRVKNLDGGSVEMGAGSAKGILFPPDTNLYRDAPNSLKTDDALAVVGALNSLGPTLGIKGYACLMFGGNTAILANGVTDLFFGMNAAGSAQMRMGMPGQVIGISIQLSANLSAGTLVAQMYNNSTPGFVGPSVTLNTGANNTLQTSIAEPAPGVANDFSANSLMRMRLTATGFAPTTAIPVVIVWVKLT